ncbi:MAG: tRNA (adenosine(37)-N6)-threonylcarbamoyltransferase complex ATPase subunit type 1 TsaE [Candidatus Kapaibacterium sp.]
METENHKTYSEEETIELGRDFAKKLKPGDVVVFFGDLGSGKTEFIKGICDYFEVEEIVTSPTFTIMNQYSGNIGDKEITIFHIDLYRIKSNEELEEIGFRECIYAKNAIKLVEWAEKAESKLPDNKYVVTIKLDNENENLRKFDIINEYKIEA